MSVCTPVTSDQAPFPCRSPSTASPNLASVKARTSYTIGWNLSPNFTYSSSIIQCTPLLSSNRLERHPIRPRFTPSVQRPRVSHPAAAPSSCLIPSRVGSGTGIFTRAFLAHPGCSAAVRELRAVEPSMSPVTRISPIYPIHIWRRGNESTVLSKSQRSKGLPEGRHLREHPRPRRLGRPHRRR